MGKTYRVVVHGPKGEKLTIDLCNTEEEMKSMTVLQLKEKIEERLPEYTVNQQRLIFGSEPLVDGRTVTGYGIRHMSSIRMELEALGGWCALF